MNLVSVLLLIVLLEGELDIIVVIFVILLAFHLILNLIIIFKRFNSYKNFKKIIIRNKEKVKDELINALYVNYREYILTENYIVDLRDYKIITYEEIKYIYYCKKGSLISNSYPLTLTLITNKEKISLRIWSCFFHLDDYYEDLENLVKIKNPNVIKCKKKDIKKLMKDIV